ncbi:lipoprotein [Legionella birminghamensis]|uniref:Lipoprotein n=1 Tax=Legionella birminghamensis TaxID=28083 RepID=A0A378IEU8_9GAMM|nr:penicillin-binding protein activator [Legionella birminghamensis]KTC68777.1 lipoprotein [Legionella birminghamensis]STX33282.1 lipoprotein [Legionella birminghamensis]
MLVKSRFAKLSLLTVSVFFLTYCTRATVENRPMVRQSQAPSPFSMPAEAYLAMANNQSGDEKNGLLILAAGRYLNDGQWREANDILTQSNELNAVQNSEKNILLAKIDMMRDQPKSAISRLAAIQQSDEIPPYFITQYHEVLANAYEAGNNAVYAINERIKLDKLLADESKLNNQKLLWLDLTRLPIAELNTMDMEAKEGSELKGWLRLALISRQPDSGSNLVYKVQKWQEIYGDHPANGLLPSSLAAIKPNFHDSGPQQIALLLPLTGALAGPGTAIRDGFMSAHNADNSGRTVNVQVYDTASADVVGLYQQAIENGADYVVGPLTKADVSRVAAVDHPVPTIFLNDAEVENNQNTYHFGLSPSNEARQVAVKASKKGLRRALIIAPAGSWGSEIVTAFNEQWKSSGGLMVDQLTYDNQSDLNKGIRELLHVSEKKASEKQFKPGSEEAKLAGPIRRQDFDMIFLLAYPSKARQIMPLLKYYFAGDVPVFATSTVYAGTPNTMRDRDLDGIIFCDMPWVFNHQLASKNWPEQYNSYNRLYAIGADSYTLGTQLNQLLLFPAMGINDNNGVLYLNRSQQVARVMAWGRFSGGVARLTSETT